VKRLSKLEIEKQYETVLLNVLTYNERLAMDYRQRKVEAYVNYRQWREQLRKHQEFIKNIKCFGMAALQPAPKLPTQGDKDAETK
jgi:hypothetical protein